MEIVVAGGMTLTVHVIETLCKLGVKPAMVIGYPQVLSHRSNFASLESVSNKYSLTYFEVADINSLKVGRSLSRLSPDWLIVAGWSQIIKETYLSIPRKGVLGFHMSKLPEGRGRAPVAWTLIKGLPKASVTLQWLGAGVDDGDIAVQRSIDLSVTDDAATLVPKINLLAGDILESALPLMMNDSLPRVAQDSAKATYWPKRSPSDGRIDWDRPVEILYNFIRGLTPPFPGAFSFCEGDKWIVCASGILKARHEYPSGLIVGPYFAHGPTKDHGLVVAAKGGFLIFRELIDGKGEVQKGERLVKIAEEFKGTALR